MLNQTRLSGIILLLFCLNSVAQAAGDSTQIGIAIIVPTTVSNTDTKTDCEVSLGDRAIAASHCQLNVHDFSEILSHHPSAIDHQTVREADGNLSMRVSITTQ